jgi:hypothetical protein
LEYMSNVDLSEGIFMLPLNIIPLFKIKNFNI